MENNSQQNSYFQRHMIDYIKEHFGDLLGEHVELLEKEGGLDKLSEMINSGKFSRNL